MSRLRPARVAAAVAMVVAVLAAVVVVWPQGLGVADVFGPAQLVAMRGVGVLAGTVVAVVVGVVALVLRGSRAVTVPVAVVAIAASVASLAIMTQRGWSDDAPAGAGDRAGGGSDGDGADGDVRVLAFNTLYDQIPSGDIAALIERHDADVVVLPETSLATTQEVADRVGGMQVRHRHIDAITSSTGLLVADRLGPYGDPLPQVDGHLGSFVVRPEGDGPPIVAVHAYPPGTGAMPWWRRDTAWAVEQCTSMPGAIVAGDFNATLDHPAMGDHDGGCVDAAAERGAAAVGTWPSTWPTWLGAPIDHVLVDSRAWDVVSFSVLDAHPGSDHRPVLAVLRRR